MALSEGVGSKIRNRIEDVKKKYSLETFHRHYIESSKIHHKENGKPAKFMRWSNRPHRSYSHSMVPGGLCVTS